MSPPEAFFEKILVFSEKQSPLTPDPYARRGGGMIGSIINSLSSIFPYRKFEETENLITKLKIQEDNGEPGHNNLIANTQTAVKTVERSFSAEPTNGNQATRYSTGTDTRDIVVGVASKKPKDEAGTKIFFIRVLLSQPQHSGPEKLKKV